jgi:hypothetical protein
MQVAWQSWRPRRRRLYGRGEGELEHSHGSRCRELFATSDKRTFPCGTFEITAVAEMGDCQVVYQEVASIFTHTAFVHDVVIPLPQQLLMR